jgi:hypothetical protein
MVAAGFICASVKTMSLHLPSSFFHQIFFLFVVTNCLPTPACAGKHGFHAEQRIQKRQDIAAVLSVLRILAHKSFNRNTL